MDSYAQIVLTRRILKAFSCPAQGGKPPLLWANRNPPNDFVEITLLESIFLIELFFKSSGFFDKTFCAQNVN